MSENLAIRFLLKRKEREQDKWRDSEDLTPGRAALLDLAARERASQESEEKLNRLHASLNDGKRVTVTDMVELYEDGGLRARAR
jgi:hypothetical protein